VAAIYPIPESLNQNWKGVQDWLQKEFGDYAPGLLMPKTPKDAYESGIPGMGVMPAGELNQGQNYNRSLQSLADMLGVDKSKLMQLFGTNAGR
jgi:hypothetical protein